MRCLGGLDEVREVLGACLGCDRRLDSTFQCQIAHAPCGCTSCSAGEKLDPRAAIAGLELASPPGHTSDSSWQSGLFDRGSWMEAQVGG